MSWLIIEGIDRSGKSTIAALYKEQGYDLVHMSAPDKKYKQPGYSGPSYLDDMLDVYMQYDGKDVVFDRSIYGECVWPHVYGREPSLTEDDIEILQEFEDRNQTSRILMVDLDQAGHWKRCVDNNEPLTQSQFRLAHNLYTKLAHKYNFVPKQLSDFNHELSKSKNQNDQSISSADTETAKNKPPVAAGKSINDPGTDSSSPNKTVHEKGSGLEKLEKANAISAVLSKRLIKQRGESFDELEGEVTDFLKRRLEELLGINKITSPSFLPEEVEILKMFCQRLKEKEKATQTPTPIPRPSVGQLLRKS